MLLFEPIKIGALEIKNRIIMAPMSLNMVENGYVTERMIRFYKERAKGGVGLITIGDGIVASPVGKNVKESTLIDDDRYVPMLKKLADAVKSNGAKIALQLSHGGRRAGRVSSKGFLDVTEGLIPVAPSPLPHPVPGQVVPRELTKEEIREIVLQFGEAARRTQEAGFDALGLHCAHMYLCGTFLSPWANRRTDEYGRDFDGRLKFVLEVIEEVKSKTRGDLPLIVRMNGEEPEGGNSLEQIGRIAERLEKAGADAIHVSVGFGAPSKTSGVIPSVTAMRERSGCIVHLAENIKRNVSIPVIAVNKIDTIAMAEEILQHRRADVISFGRPLIADPYLPAKAERGDLDLIRPCIYCCQGCLQNVLEHDAPVACSVNPEAGKEGRFSKGSDQRKRVMILGAGPAGLQTALAAAGMLHDVYLFEKTNRLGGDLHLAARLDAKKPVKRYLEYLIRQVYNSDIHLMLNQDVDSKTLERVDPDVAVIATGSRSVRLEIPGCSRLNSATAEEILSDREVDGQKVVIVGGGPTGCEAAEFLAERGKDVAIVEIMDDIALNTDRINRVALLNALERLNVVIYTKSEVKSVNGRDLQIESLGRTITLEADFIVLAAGKQPVAEDIDSILKQHVAQVHVIGDKVSARGIMAAVHEGFQTALKI